MRYSLLFFPLLLLACSSSPKPSVADPATLSWEEIVEEARGSTVRMMMWQGDPLINKYMHEFVAQRVAERYEITLQIAGGQGAMIVQQLMAEMQAGKDASELDLLWINGETFYQLRQIDGLYGPWTGLLPNGSYIDWENPFIALDFQQPVEGYECPWGNVQLALIYNSAYVPDPPRNRQELAEFARANPGRFTWDVHFTGLTFLKSLLIDLAGGPEALSGSFDEVKYRKYSELLWAYIRDIRPYLWKEGKTFPEAVAPMHQLFASGELWFTMSNNDSEVDNKVQQGIFPETARAYVWDGGTIQNSHYLGIPRLSANKAGAMVVADYMISAEAQYWKQNPAIWGDGTVLEVSRLPEKWQQRFGELPGRKYAPAREEMQERALPELAPEYMIRLAEDFRKKIVEEGE